MESKIFKNMYIINFPDVDFDLVLFYILHLTSLANKITGWYFGVGEDRVYATGVASADKIFVWVRQFSSSRVVKQKNKSSAALQFSDLALKKNEEKQNAQFDPWFITGFFDGEGCFNVSITKNKKLNLGWGVRPCFLISIHEKDKALLQEIKSYLGVGKIYKQGSQSIQLRVESIKELQAIINHFDEYPLITEKWSYFRLFKQVFKLVERKEHLTAKGLRKILAIKASMNNGLSEGLKIAFPDIVPVARPLVLDK